MSKHRLGSGPVEGPTYEGYLQIPALIGLQRCLTDPPQHDEMLFIVTHQAYELWFREVLFELDAVVEALEADDPLRATHLLRRVAAIERVLVAQVHVLETMKAVDFLAFRDHLNPASGFQSVQFREVEFVSGLKEPKMLDEFRGDPVASDRLRRRLEGTAIPEAFQGLLRRSGVDQPEGDDAEAAEARVRGLVVLYGDDPRYRDLFELAESLLDHDEQLQFWRFHHLRMVERMIGAKSGTGGSEGVRYLQSTLGKKCFPDLWSVRTHLVRSS